MKIYFAGSIRGGRGDVEIYSGIIAHLRSRGEVLTEHVGNADLSSSGEEGLTDTEIYRRDVGWIDESDVVVAEVSTPSLGVGYEIAMAEDLGKPVLCLFQESSDRRLSAMISGTRRSLVKTYRGIGEAVSAIDAFLAGVPPR